jgi:hypothetical protein
MKVTTRILTLSLIAGTSLLASTGASASWWGGHHDDDYWDGPWGYPGYGWGGYPGYGGWGGYPGYGGWGGYGYPGYGGWGGYPGYGWGSGAPQVIYTEPKGSSSPPPRRIE